MAHYAFLDENNIVTEVIVGRDEDDLVDGINNWEDHYQEIKGQTCKRTSYNTYGNTHYNGKVPFRYNYAAIGYLFDESIGQDGAFIPKKPEDRSSFILDLETCTWVPPLEKPKEPEDPSKVWDWNEESISWILINNPIYKPLSDAAE